MCEEPPRLPLMFCLWKEDIPVALELFSHICCLPRNNISRHPGPQFSSVSWPYVTICVSSCSLNEMFLGPRKLLLVDWRLSSGPRIAPGPRQRQPYRMRPVQHILERPTQRGRGLCTSDTLPRWPMSRLERWQSSRVSLSKSPTKKWTQPLQFYFFPLRTMKKSRPRHI